MGRDKKIRLRPLIAEMPSTQNNKTTQDTSLMMALQMNIWNTIRLRTASASTEMLF